MLHGVVVTCKVWERLFEIDRRIAARVAADGCSHCGGRLHRGDYPRKLRGGLIAAAAEGATRRISLCCDRDGCRRRATPPSVRFLGRKVYVGAAVVIACIVAQSCVTAGAIRRTTGIAKRTILRWADWWQFALPRSPFWEVLRSRFVPPVETSTLPQSLVLRFAERGPLGALERVLALVAPVTTTSVDLGSRFVWVV